MENVHWPPGNRNLDVLAQLAPRFVLVAGKRLWSKLPSGRKLNLERSDGSSWPAREYAGPDGEPILATYINHPSSYGFSWHKWSDVAAALRSQSRAA